MSKAEEKAYEAYPKISRISEPHGLIPADNKSHYLGDANEEKREGFIAGYHQAERDLTDKAKTSSGWDGFFYGQGYKQAEKDNELTWEDISDILDVTDVIANDDSMEERLKTMSEEEYCKEVLKRFKERKKKIDN